MSEVIIDSVKFKNVPDKRYGTKIGDLLTQSNVSISQSVASYMQSDDFYTLVNSVDIDWNGIEIDANTEINTTADLIKWIKSKGGGTIADRSITAAKIATNTITSNEIAENAITDSELSDDAVSTNKIQNGAVTPTKIADNTITAAKMTRLTGNLEFNGGNINFFHDTTSTTTDASLGTMKIGSNYRLTASSPAGLQLLRYKSAREGYAQDFFASASGVEIGGDGGASIMLNGKTLADSSNVVTASGYKITNKSDDDVVLAGGGTVPLSSISGGGGGTTYTEGTWAQIQTGTDTTAKVWSPKTLKNLIDTTSVADGSVTAAKIAAGAVTAAKIDRLRGDLELDSSSLSFVSFYPGQNAGLYPDAQLGVLNGDFSVLKQGASAFSVRTYDEQEGSYSTDLSVDSTATTISSGTLNIGSSQIMHEHDDVESTDTLHIHGLGMKDSGDSGISLDLTVLPNSSGQIPTEETLMRITPVGVSVGDANTDKKLYLNGVDLNMKVSHSGSTAQMPRFKDLSVSAKGYMYYNTDIDKMLVLDGIKTYTVTDPSTKTTKTMYEWRWRTMEGRTAAISRHYKAPENYLTDTGLTVFAWAQFDGQLLRVYRANRYDNYDGGTTVNIDMGECSLTDAYRLFSPDELHMLFTINEYNDYTGRYTPTYFTLLNHSSVTQQTSEDGLSISTRTTTYTLEETDDTATQITINVIEREYAVIDGN